MNKNVYHILTDITYIFLLASIVTTVQAQQTESGNTPAAFELMKTKSLWQKSSNAAGLILDNAVQYSEFATKYSFTNGDFKRPQQGDKITSLNFDTEGGTFLKGLYLWGRFNYVRDAVKGANYNASITDPYRGMPYYVADLNSSDWNNQYYNMQFKIASPRIHNVFSFGVDGIYNVSQGAKQRDIRSKPLTYALDIKPGVVYSPTEEHHLGANFQYYNFKEDAKGTSVNSEDKQKYYLLYGLGMAVENLGAGRTLNYIANQLGGGIQYNYRKDAINLLVSGNYSYKVEDVESSFENPQKFGTTKDKIWNSNIRLFVNGDRFSNKLNIEYYKSNIDGIQYIQQNTSSEGWITLHKNIRSTYSTESISADYSLIANRGNEYSWITGAGVAYLKKDDVYLLPYSEKKSENIVFNVNGKVNLFLSEKLSRRLLIGASAAYNNNISGKYAYNGSNPQYEVVTELEQGDQNYLTTNFYNLNAEITYSQKWDETQKANLFVKGSFSYQKTSDFDFGSRTYAQVSLGCNF